MRLLLVEDDLMVASGIKLGLTDAGYAVDWVSSAERALEVLAQESFDIAILDIGLPGMDGLGLLNRMRAKDMACADMPVLMLTARDGLHDRVRGLDLGADDYMVKPYELPELLARLRALLRRSQAANSAVLSFGPLALDTAARSAGVWSGGQEGVGEMHTIDLGPRMDRAGVSADPRPQACEQGQATASADRLGQGDHAECGGGVCLALACQAGAAWGGAAFHPRVWLPAGLGAGRNAGDLSGCEPNDLNSGLRLLHKRFSIKTC